MTVSETEGIYKEKVSSNGCKVTVFLMTHNRKDYLKIAIDSVLKQSHRNFVLWVLNNASTDGTEQYLKGIQDPRVVYSNTNTNPFLNMRYAKDVCSTEYFIILHDDDIVEQNYLEAMLECADEAMVDELFAGSIYIDSDGRRIDRTSAKSFDGGCFICSGTQFFENAYEIKKDDRLCQVFYPFPSVLYRTAFYQSNSEVFTDKAGPAGDQLVHFETERNGGKIGFLAKPLFRYRVHEGQESKTYAGRMNLQLLEYLSLDSYYGPMLKMNANRLETWLWRFYKGIVATACRGCINRMEWEKFFDYSFVKTMRNTSSGKRLFIKMKLLFYMPHISKGIYLVRKFVMEKFSLY